MPRPVSGRARRRSAGRSAAATERRSGRDRRTASRGCGCRTGWPTSRARTRPPAAGEGDECPFCQIPRLTRRRRPDRRPRRAGLHGAQPVPVQQRAPDGGPVPARRRLHRAGPRRRRRAGRLHQARDDRAAGRLRRAGLQHRHEHGRRWPARASPRTCTSTSCRAGAATPTSCRSSATPRCCRSCSRDTRKLIADAWPATSRGARPSGRAPGTARPAPGGAPGRTSSASRRGAGDRVAFPRVAIRSCRPLPPSRRGATAAARSAGSCG